MRAPTEMSKFTLLSSSILSDLIAEEIWVCFSGGGAAVAEVAALPVVLLSVEDLDCALFMPSLDIPSLDMPSLDCALFILLLRSSAFMSLAPLALSVSELMLFDFSPFTSPF